MAYTPEGTGPLDPRDEWIIRELRRIAANLDLIEQGRALPILHNEPLRPREGTIVLADGSDWNPGNGYGCYIYLSAAWVPMANIRDALFDTLYLNQNLVLPRAQGHGILVDLADPTYTWRDLEGEVLPKDVGVGAPVFKTFRGNIKLWAFKTGDFADLTYHMPHDWVPGSDLHLHIHWTHNGTGITGNIQIDYRWTYQKGHNQGVYPADTTFTQTIATSIATYPQYAAVISETQFSAASPSGGQLDTDLLEPDGLIRINAYIASAPTVTGGDFFIEYVDIHYQSCNIGTKNKSPDFW